MKNPALSNPYKAGFGLTPPYFAGRREEVEEIEKALDEIKGKAGRMHRSPIPVLALVGPRGVGKTVLLERADEMAQERGIHVGVIDNKLLLSSQNEIVRKILPVGEAEKSFNRPEYKGGPKLGLGLTHGVYEEQKSLRPAMLEYLTKRPMLLILDEAHRCEPEGLIMLFNVVQKCMRKKLPLAVIIAGTPGLVRHLRHCDYTYEESTRFLCFNTLVREEAHEALKVPAEDAGRPMDEAALDSLLDWTNKHPYFIQMAGSLAWDASVARDGN